MTEYKARDSFYANGGRHFTKGQVITAAIFGALSQGDKWWFDSIEVPDPPPPQRTVPRPSGPPPPALSTASASNAAQKDTGAPRAITEPKPPSEVSGSTVQSELLTPHQIIGQAMAVLSDAKQAMVDTSTSIANAHETLLQKLEERSRAIEEKLVSEFNLVKEKIAEEFQVIKQNIHGVFHPGGVSTSTPDAVPPQANTEQTANP